MAARIVEKSDQMVVVRRKIASDSLEADRLCNEFTSPEGRVRAVANTALSYCKSKAVDIDALRLDRYVRFDQKKMALGLSKKKATKKK